MNKLVRLVAIELKALFDISTLLKSKVKSDRLKLIGVVALTLYVVIALGGTVVLYTTNLIKMFGALGAPYLSLVMMYASASLIAVLAALYRANGTLFNFKTYDMLAALPLTSSTLLGSRVVLGVIVDSLPLMLFMVPAGVTYGIQVQPDWWFYPVFIVTLCMLPLIPFVGGSALGVISSLIAARFKSNGLVNIGIGFLLIFGLMYAEFSLINSDNLGSIVTTITNSITAYYPVARWYGEALSGNVLSLIVFVGLSIAIFAGSMVLLSRWFKHLNSATTTSIAKQNYTLAASRPRSAFGALLRKEFGLYFGSSIYVFNTAFGLVLMGIGAIAVHFAGNSALAALQAIPQLKTGIAWFVPLALSALVGLSCTTSASISIEGKRLWVTKTLPIALNRILLAKLLVNVIICASVSTIAGVSLGIFLKVSAEQMLMAIAVPAVCACAVAACGLLANLALPSLSWSAEVQAVKQSAAVLVGMLMGIILVAAPIVSVLTGWTSAHVASYGALIGYAIITIVCLYMLGTWGVKRLQAIDA